MEEKLLYELGLTGNESKVYIKLLGIGSATAGEITQNSGIHRRNVYDCIERLMEKGLISFVVINNRKYFRAEDPERLIDLIEERKSRLDIHKKLLDDLIPKLKPITEHAKQDVRFYRGREGLKSVYDDILRTGKSYIGYGPGEQIEKILRHYLTHYISSRIKRKIKASLIYGESSRGKWFVSNRMLEVKYLPDHYSSHAALRIYGDKVAIMLFSEDEPLAIVIENKNIAEGYRKYFEIIWEAARK